MSEQRDWQVGDVVCDARAILGGRIVQAYMREDRQGGEFVRWVEIGDFVIGPQYEFEADGWRLVQEGES